jgi:hypothetical protein
MGLLGLAVETPEVVDSSGLTEAGWGGGLAEHIVLPTSTLYRLPDNVSFEMGGKRLLYMRLVYYLPMQRWWSHSRSDGML